ncbi:right-handed parallel beta-helix repeat-containing protein, partial [Candidatus Micrarchaeota archaeon]|nr:right-handed parallel beta-helix repeat-containing protein [Candidatus Micrarchaeota archaeon]
MMYKKVMLLLVVISVFVSAYEAPSKVPVSVRHTSDGTGNILIPVQKGSGSCESLYLDKGWNLVSFPMDSVVLPSVIKVYALADGKYVTVREFVPGTGYWAYSEGYRKVEVCGSPVSSVTWKLSPGTQFLGGPSSEVSVDEVRETLDARVGRGKYKLDVYEYSQGKYQPTKVIRPFVGYLVKYEGPETKVVLGSKEGVCDHTFTFSDRVKERVVDGLEIDYLGMTKDGRFRFVVYDKSAGKKEMFNLTEGERFTYVSHKRVGKEKTSPAVKYTFSLLDVGNVSQGSSQPTIPGAISRPVRPVGPSSEVSLCVDEMNVTCIYDCTDITEPGDYVLCSDIVVSHIPNSSSSCIHILSNNVTLDGMDHSMMGRPELDGIYSVGDYVVIENVEISGFKNGIYLYYLPDPVRHNIVNNTHLYNNTRSGIFVSGSDNILVGNKIYGNNYGIFEVHTTSGSFSNNMIIKNDISFNNLDGVLLDGSNDSVISNNITSNLGSGIYLYINARSNVITNNTVLNNSEKGISISLAGSPVNNTFINNRVCFNYYHNRSLDIYDTTGVNTFINTTYDTSEPDDPDYFDKIGSCTAECPEGYTSVDVGERLFLGSFDGHDYYFYRSSESDYQILEDDSVVFDSSTSSEGDGGILYGLPNGHFVGVEMLRGHPSSGYCVLGINGSFSHVESGDMFIPP